jgi:tryptophan synthase alpha chain
MNRIKELFAKKSDEILNVYFTAGHPELESTVQIIHSLDKAGADLVEVGIPYSDPLADGLTIQQSSQRALKNGMSLELLFDQISRARQKTDLPLVMMGYYNQMLQYGPERFIESCVASGVDGLIIPDLPLSIFEQEYEALFREKGIMISFLITPQTSDERIRLADRLSSGFIYMVSKSSITGGSSSISPEQEDYFNRIRDMDLASPRLIGFGIHDRQTFETAAAYGNGAIIGSAFIRILDGAEDLDATIQDYIRGIKNLDA